jgi:hypothetical protein
MEELVDYVKEHVDHVMVPVPEELRAEVEYFLMVRDMAFQTTKIPLNKGGFEQLLLELDQACRDVLSLGAAAALLDSDLSIREIADALDWSAHETFGVAHKLCELTVGAVGPKVSIVQGAPDTHRGSIDMRAKRLVVARDVASIVSAADERA